jgi:hypothetical protein
MRSSPPQTQGSVLTLTWSAPENMFSQLLAGALVSFLNFGVHALITGVIVLATGRMAARTDHLHVFMRVVALMTVTMIGLMCAHVCEIAVWSVYYTWEGVAPVGTTPFEFAFENYTALGYGEPAPPEGKRLVGPITSHNRLLLIGWSVAIIFEVMRMAEVKFVRLEDKPDEN